MTHPQKIRICVAGATGWAGGELCKGIAQTEDLELVSAVSRQYAQQDLNKILELNTSKPIPIFANIETALQIPCDVLVEYTKPDVAKHHILHALGKNIKVIVGTSGLSDEDYAEIRAVAEQKQGAVLAVGNFAISVVLLNKFAEMAARYMPYWEIIDYAKDSKVDAPSGSARELVNRLSQVGQPILTVPLAEIKGVVETRGASMHGTQVHSVRLPGFVISLEAIFGLEDEKLTIKHEAGKGAKPYVGGALLAIRKVGSFTGLKRGLDSVMD